MEFISNSMFAQYFQKGGIMMYPLLLCSVISVAIIINKLWNFRHANTDVEILMRKIKKFAKDEKIQAAISYCNSTPGPVAHILSEGLKEYESGRVAMEEAMQTAGLSEVPRLEQYLPVLHTIGSVATLIGFTGTVLGMIRAFNAIALAGLSSPSIVATGIAEALTTTATGLLIAIPALVFYNYLSHRVDRFMLQIEKSSTEMVYLLSGRGEEDEV
ncbi:MAG: MotA/TolQ/ExbB proton channel family protein [bacterium]